MLCVIENMPTYVTNLHRLAGNILSTNGRELYANDFYFLVSRCICTYIFRAKQELGRNLTRR